jgi:O-antigen/teichoic acid export membrane protein
MAVASARASHGKGFVMTTTMTTRSRMFIAAGWLIGSNLSAQALRLASSLVLTRLLLPDAFGLMAAVNTLYFGLVMFSDLGVWQSIVKTKHSPSLAFLGTAWTVQLVRSGILAFIVALIAAGLMLAQRWGWPPAGSIYADPRLPLLILVFVLSAGLQGAESMKIALVQRSMDLKPLARMEVLSQLGATLLTIALAITFRSIWALAIGTVFSSMLRTVLSHTLLHGPAIRPVWSIEHAAEILSFGRWIFVSSIIGFLAAHGEKLILAAFLSTTAFGVFSIASTLLAALIGLYSSVNGHVVFSSLSETLRANDPVKLRTMYRRVQQSADFLLGAMAGCLFSAGHWVVWFL